MRVGAAYDFLKTLRLKFFEKYTIEQARGAVGGISYKLELEKRVNDVGSGAE